MNNNSSEILLTINLEASTVLRNGKNNEKPISKITKSTTLSEKFVDYAKSNEAYKDADVRNHKWKQMRRGERLNAMVRTIVADELKLPTEAVVNNIHFSWTLIE